GHDVRRVHLRRAPERRVPKLREPGGDVKAAAQARASELLLELRDGRVVLHDELVVVRAAEGGRVEAGDARERLPERRRVGGAGARGLLEAALPEEREVHAERERVERLVRADVARGLVAADVLLARAEREAVRALAVRVHRLADDASWHLAHVLP